MLNFAKLVKNLVGEIITIAQASLLQIKSVSSQLRDVIINPVVSARFR